MGNGEWGMDADEERGAIALRSHPVSNFTHSPIPIPRSYAAGRLNCSTSVDPARAAVDASPPLTASRT